MIPDYPHQLICPEILEVEREPLVSYIQAFHSIGLVVLDLLSRSLQLPEDEDLKKAHEPQKPSTSSLTFLKYMDHEGKMKGGHVSHTDIGSLTFLYSLDDGLQIFHPTHQTWLYGEPRPDSLVVNVGDSLSLLTGTRLKSSLHRVIPHPKTIAKNRYSFAYFMRPNETALLKMPDGEVCKSLDWHCRKLGLFAAPLAVQNEQHAVMHGRF